MKIGLKNKIINHLIKNGSKYTCENALLKSFKILQKSSMKSYKKIIKLSIINMSPVFRILVLKKKKLKKQTFAKEVPMFVTKDFERISWSIKNILCNMRANSFLKLQNKLSQELFLSAKSNEELTKVKNNTLKQAFNKKRLLLHFRW